MKLIFSAVTCVLLVVSSAHADAPTTRPTQGAPVPAVLNFTMKSLDGKDVPLSKYQGKVVLMVNTASKCGYTPQYKGLEALYRKYADKGLVVVGFPSNDFGHQEPGTNDEISTFCSTRYGVTFDLFSKVDVKGADQCDLYKYLTSPDTDPQFPGEVKWNFEKFLIAKDGTIVQRFRSKVTPESEELVKAVEAELAK